MKPAKLNIAIIFILFATGVFAETYGNHQGSYHQKSDLFIKVGDKKNIKPTGACYINAGGIKNCTSYMTQEACYRVASNVHGVASWIKGETCK